MCADLILPIDHWVSHRLRCKRERIWVYTHRKSERERASLYMCWILSQLLECVHNLLQVSANENSAWEREDCFMVIKRGTLIRLWGFIWFFLSWRDPLSHTRRIICPCSCFTPKGVLYWSRAFIQPSLIPLCLSHWATQVLYFLRESFGSRIGSFTSQFNRRMTFLFSLPNIANRVADEKSASKEREKERGREYTL